MELRGCVISGMLAPLMMGSTLMELGTNYIFHGKRRAALRRLPCLATSKKKKKKPTTTPTTTTPHSVHVTSLCKFSVN
jgi:hypothetical protein